MQNQKVKLYQMVLIQKISKEKNTKKEKFTISYFGNITSERNPEITLKALNQLPIMTKKCSLEFWGNVSKNVVDGLRKLDEYHVINFHPYISHEEVLRKMISSDLLLLIINNVPDNKGILTGKIYEYVGSGVPILGIGPVDGEAAEILIETESGQMFDYKDKIGIAEFIQKTLIQNLRISK